MTVPSSSSYYQNKVVVVTGGGSGIGKALCQAFARAGASVVVADLRGASAVQQTLPGGQQRHSAFRVDVTDPTAVADTIRSVQRAYGKIDVYCSNAGIMVPSDARDDSCVKHSLQDWKKILDVNVTSHVTALRALLPEWERGVGDGHFCVTASAAGLLTMVGDASYGVSKAAALSFCEHVSISHADSVKVHCLCPQAVDTPLVTVSKESNAALSDGMLSPEKVAEVALEGIQRNDFFVFPHEAVPKYAVRKAQDHARWLKGMRRLRNHLMPKKNDKKGKNSNSKMRSKL